MSTISIVELANKMGSLFKLTVLVSKRAVMLAHGAPSLIKGIDPKLKPTVIALEELQADQLHMVGAPKVKASKKKES